ncbi:MAG: hypothetical protein QF713_00830, partial [Dehalococcoidales bacterium]|nr:hypothetical protein [Dehalococcoidales bacterium]
MAGAGQHPLHSLFGGDDYRQAIRVLGPGSIEYPGNNLGLPVKLFGFLQCAFEEYPRMIGRPPAALPLPRATTKRVMMKKRLKTLLQSIPARQGGGSSAKNNTG